MLKLLEHGPITTSAQKRLKVVCVIDLILSNKDNYFHIICQRICVDPTIYFLLVKIYYKEPFLETYDASLTLEI